MTCILLLSYRCCASTDHQGGRQPSLAENTFYIENTFYASDHQGGRQPSLAENTFYIENTFYASDHQGGRQPSLAGLLPLLTLLTLLTLLALLGVALPPTIREGGSPLWRVGPHQPRPVPPAAGFCTCILLPRPVPPACCCFCTCILLLSYGPHQPRPVPCAAALHVI